MKYDFDKQIERHGTNSYKWDLPEEGVIPMWVADMDFRTPDFIVNAIKKRLEHEIFGYTFDSDSYYNSIIEWVHYKHNWKIQREWLSYIPGIVKGIGFVLQCFTKPGDKVIIQPPFIMTDWYTSQDTTALGMVSESGKYSYSDGVQCIKAGNDLQMPGCRKNVEDIVDGAKNGRITKADLQRCAKHILGIALKTI